MISLRRGGPVRNAQGGRLISTTPPPYPGGLWGIWRLCLTRLYRLERLRYSGRSRLMPYIWPVVWAGVFALSAGIVELGSGPLCLLPASVIAVWGLPLGCLAGACIAGTRAFGSERGQDTRDALVMTTVRREVLVGTRFLLVMGPYAVFGILVSLLPLAFLIWVASSSGLPSGLMGIVPWALALAMETLFVTFMFLCAAAGLLKGLSSRTRAYALLWTFPIMLGVGLGEILVCSALACVEFVPRSSFEPIWWLFYSLVLFVGAWLNSALAAFCLRRAARKFDELLLAE
jgi:hypothetical protein